MRLSFDSETSFLASKRESDIIMKGYNSKVNIIFGLTFLTLAVAIPAPKFNNVHEYMTDEELKGIFQTERHNVPRYHVTPLYCPKLHKRSADSSTRLRVNVFGNDIDLLLNPVDGILATFDTPVYLASNLHGKNIFQKVSDPMAHVGKMLEDREKKATFMVKKNDDDKYTLSGTIDSEGVVVKPLSPRLNKHCNRLKRSAEEPEYFKNATLGEYSDPVYHVIYKKRETHDNGDYIDLNIEKDSSTTKASRSKRSVPEVIYPQILVLIDYAKFQLHDSNVYGILEYLLPFWHGVDLRFRALEAPKVRFNIAGIVIANDPYVFSFLTKNKVTSDMIDAGRGLKSFSTYMYKVKSDFPLDSYDIAVAMSSYNLCSSNKERCVPGTLGMAYLGAACKSWSGQDPTMSSVALVHDTGAFEGISTATHEIGHLFGSSHDGSNGFGCPEDKGYIMAPIQEHTIHSVHWSECSLKQFSKFFRHQNPDCLYNKPNTTALMPRVLPGRLFTKDEQCMKLSGTKSCRGKENGCTQLWCIAIEDKNSCRGPMSAVVDGTICDTGKICYYGQCLSETEIM